MIGHFLAIVNAWSLRSAIRVSLFGQANFFAPWIGFVDYMFTFHVFIGDGFKEFTRKASHTAFQSRFSIAMHGGLAFGWLCQISGGQWLQHNLYSRWHHNARQASMGLCLWVGT